MGVATFSAASAAAADPPTDARLDVEVALERAPPPPTNVVYFQYGVSLAAEVVAAAGPICNNVTVPCILGPGGGVAVRGGWRSSGAVYLGGAYEVTKQDPNKLYRLALLQQARGEFRYYLSTARDFEPYVSGSLGVAGYGNEWAIDTWGPLGGLGGGVEIQIARTTVIGFGLAYRLAYFKAFTDTSGARRDGGVTQLLGLDFLLEQREPVFTRARND